MIRASSLTLRSSLIFVILFLSRTEMGDYSIGDRVEVRWETELFDSTVVKVNPSGSVDVTYDIDGSEGIFLTAKDHGLKLLGDNEKKGGGGKKKGQTGRQEKGRSRSRRRSLSRSRRKEGAGRQAGEGEE